MNPSARFFALESDAFFAEHDLRAVLNGRPVDLAFIDGMHHFEVALRDFMNLERFCSNQSTILVHDCYPRDRETAGREHTSQFWSGDVWKLVLCISEYRPDVRIFVVDVPPTGVGIITNLDPDSTVLKNRYDEIFGAFIDLDYSVLDQGKDEMLNVVPNDWRLVRELLPQPVSSG